MQLIIRWLMLTGIGLVGLGLWGMYVYLIKGVHDTSDGISALVRVITGCGWIFMAMGLYRVDIQMFSNQKMAEKISEKIVARLSDPGDNKEDNRPTTDRG